MACGCTFCATFKEEGGAFCAKFGETTQVLPDPYAGPYRVIPKFIEQILPTKKKSMADDTTVEAIPVDKVTNPGGGYTVTIGG